MAYSDRVAFRCFNDSRFLFYITDTQDGYLRLIDDRSGKEVLECTEVSDRESSSLYIIRRKFIGTCFIGQRIDGNGKAVQIQLVGITYDRDNQVAVIQ